MATRVYLAGKIAATDDWRRALFPSSAEVLAAWHAGGCRGPRPPLADLDRPGWEYVGPVYQPCRHGGWPPERLHGRNRADLPAAGCCTEVEEPSPANAIVEACLAALDRAELVFAWLEARDAYGTLVELGYAARGGVPLFLAWPTTPTGPGVHDAWLEHIADLWFARALAGAWTVAPTVHDAWRACARWWAARPPRPAPPPTPLPPWAHAALEDLDPPTEEP